MFIQLLGLKISGKRAKGNYGVRMQISRHTESFGEEGITKGRPSHCIDIDEATQTILFLEDSVPQRCRIFFAALALRQMSR